MDTTNQNLIKQRWLLNLALLVITLSLGLFVFYTARLEKKPPEQPSLISLEPAKVQVIRIERAEKGLIELKREAPENWQLVTPLELPANKFRVNQLLQILTTRNYREIATNAPTLAEIGLDKPLVKISFDEHAIAFGTPSPLDSSQRYLQIAEKIYLVTDTLYSVLTGEPSLFASLSPLGENPKIVEMQLLDAHLRLLTGGKWEISTQLENIDTRADTINQFIDRWQNVQAFDIKPFTESDSSEKITITLAGQTEPITWVVVARTPDLILARPSKKVQYQFPLSQTDKLLNLPIKPVDPIKDEKPTVSPE